jgi:formate dehydrogenase maturation protein FdhE
MAKQNTIETCPKCGGVGMPLAVRTEDGKVLVNFRCPYCQTEWEAVRLEEKTP